MPAAGKSTVAERLSHHLKLPWISTDAIGHIMRAIANRDEHPALFTWDAYEAGESWRQLTAEQIADNEFTKAEAVWPGVRQLIQQDFVWNDGFIVEGDDILPHLVARDVSPSVARTVFLGDRDPARVREVAAARQPFWGDDKEVEWVLNYGEKLKAQVDQHSFSWVEVEKSEADLARVLAALDV